MEKGNQMFQKQKGTEWFIFYGKRIFCCFLCCFLLMGCGSEEGLVLQQLQQLDQNPSYEEHSPEAFVSEEREVLYVYVCGAVEKPGVYELPVGARWVDALEAAGGFSAEAARESVNLAKLLKDEDRVYLPTMEEAFEQGFQEETSGKVNLNTADLNALCTLPGVGQSRAEAILAYREEHGDFREPEDLMRVSGIKENTYEKLKDRICVR